MFLATYALADGAHVWSQRFGRNSGTDYAHAVVTDSAANIYMTGIIRHVLDMGGGDLDSSGNDIFVASYDPDGAHRWSVGIPDYNSVEIGRAIALSSTQVVVAGWLETSVYSIDGHGLSGWADGGVIFALVR